MLTKYKGFQHQDADSFECYKGHGCSRPRLSEVLWWNGAETVNDVCANASLKRQASESTAHTSLLKAMSE